MPKAPKTMALRATPAKGMTGNVDRDKGIIHGIAVTTMGEAKGHGVHLDEEFIDETVKNINAEKNGIKSRFGHPSMSSSAVGTYLGRVKNARKENKGDGVYVARADLHLADSAKVSPNGDLHKYVLEMAENDPDQFGTSIVFERGNTYKRGIAGEKVYRYNRDGSYNDDYRNTDGPEYVEQKRLRADDVVDTPAANPDGLFSAFSADQPAAVVTEFLDQNPEIWDMLQADDVEEIFNAFKERYESYRERNPKPKKEEPLPMAEEPKNTPDRESTVAELSALKKAFPDDLKFAVKAFESGQSVQEAKADYCDVLGEKCKDLESQLAAKPTTEKTSEGEDPVIHHEAKLQQVGEPSKQDQFDKKVEEFKASGMSSQEANEKAIREHGDLIT